MKGPDPISRVRVWHLTLPSVKFTRLVLNYFRVIYKPFELVTILLFIKLQRCLLPIDQDEIRYRG